MVASVLVGRTGYLGRVPMNSKAQFDLATKKVIAFGQALGYDDVMLRCDNEPSVLQLQRLVIQARLQMGPRTQACTPSAYEHGNAIAESGIQRISGLAGSLTHGLQTKSNKDGSYSEFQPCAVVLVLCLDPQSIHLIKASPHTKWFVESLMQGRFASTVNQRWGWQNHLRRAIHIGTECYFWEKLMAKGIFFSSTARPSSSHDLCGG